MKRRAFLQLLIGTAVVATIPVPKFLLKEESVAFTIPDHGPLHYTVYGHSELTQEVIEDAAQKALDNFGRPDYILMDEEYYWVFHQYMMSAKVVYR